MSRMSIRTDFRYGYTRLIGLIGQPAGPWLSTMIHNAAFQALGLDWRYVPMPVPEGQLHNALLGLRALGFAGAEVSEPYQSEALDYLEEVSLAAKTIGAVKYVALDEDGRLVGDNVSWLAFLATLRTAVPSLNGLRPLIIGAGSAASSIVYALVREGLPLTLVDERMERAINLVHLLRHAMDEHSFSIYRWPQDLDLVAPKANLIVNATAAGTWPQVDRSPWPEDLPFPPDALAFDLVSWPSETRFLRQARASGARGVSGLSLLVREAALAFEMWTGRTPPMEVMWSVAEEVLMQQASRDVPSPQDGHGNHGKSPLIEKECW